MAQDEVVRDRDAAKQSVESTRRLGKYEQGVGQNEPPIAGLALPETIAVLFGDIGFPEVTTHRQARELEESGFFQREPLRNHVLPGLRLHDFALAVLSNRALGAPRHAILEKLAKETGETCNCTVLDGDRIVYLDCAQADRLFQIDISIGAHLPLHCTASGKLFLANMPTAERRSLIYRSPLKRQTACTITDPDLLNRQLKQIAQTGVGFDDEELIRGMVAISVPVLDENQRICLCVAVHAPAIRKSLDDLRQYVPAMQRAATELSASYFSRRPEN